jgi:thiol-disulfide isomerase/thioredoxin
MKMKKSVVCLFTGLISCSSVFSQGIRFENIPFDDAFLQAIIEKKLVLLEFSTSWSGASYHLTAGGVSEEEMRAFFDARFVSLRVDMETAGGKEIGERYGVDTYPTFLLLKTNDTEQYRITGGVSATELVEKARRGLSPANAPAILEAEHASGKMKKARVLDYVLALQDGHAADPRCTAIGRELLASLSKKEKMMPLYWPLFSDLSIAPVPSGDFTLLLDNLEQFRASIGRERVDAYLLYCYESMLEPFIAREVTTDVKNHELLNTILFQLERVDFPGQELLLLEALVARAYYERDYERAFALIEENLALLPDAKLGMFTGSFQSIQVESRQQMARIARLGDKITAAVKDPGLKEYCRAFYNVYKRLSATGVYWEDLSLEEALEQAAARDMLLFVNCYQGTDPAAGLFAREHVGEFLNQRLINIKVDTRDGEGAAIAERYRIRRYPTFLLLRPDGTLHYRMAGDQEEATFVEHLQAGMNGENAAWDWEQRYQEGDRDPAFVAGYIASLVSLLETEAAVAVASDYAASLPDSLRRAPANWYIYESPLFSPLGSDNFTYLFESRAGFGKTVGAARVDSVIYTRYMDRFVDLMAGKVVPGEGEVELWVAPLKGFRSAYARELLAAAEIARVFHARQEREEEQNIRALFNACRVQARNLKEEAAFRIGRLVFSYLMQHIDQSHLGEYNMLVNTFANRITDKERRDTIKAMVIPLSLPVD